MAAPRKLWCQQTIRITVIGPDGQSSSTHVRQPFARVGSHPKSEVVVPNSGASSLAYYFHATLDGVYWIKLEPERQRPQEVCGWMTPDTLLPLGEYQVQAALGESDSAESSAGNREQGNKLDLYHRCIEHGDAARLKIQRRSSPQQAEEQLCCRPLTVIGRCPPAKIRLKHSLVSKVHCVLFWERSALWVVDLHSANATLLEGRRIDCGRVHPGQKLRLGEVEITYVGVGGPAPAEMHEQIDEWTLQSLQDSNDNHSTVGASHDTDVGFATFPQAAPAGNNSGVSRTQSEVALGPATTNQLHLDLETQRKKVEQLQHRLAEMEKERDELKERSATASAGELRQREELDRFVDRHHAMQRELVEARKQFQSHLETHVRQVEELRQRLTETESERDALRQRIDSSSERERRQEQEFKELSDELQKQSIRQLLLQEQIQSLTHVLTRQSDPGTTKLLESADISSPRVEAIPASQPRSLVVQPEGLPSKGGRNGDVAIRGQMQLAAVRLPNQQTELSPPMTAPGDLLDNDAEGQKDLKRLVDQLLVHHAKTETSRRLRMFAAAVSVGILLLFGVALLSSVAWFSFE